MKSDVVESKPKKVISIWPLVKQSYSVVFKNPLVLLLAILLMAFIFLLSDAVARSIMMGYVQTLPEELTEADIDNLRLVGIGVQLLVMAILAPLHVCIYLGVQKVYLEKIRTGTTSIKYFFSPFRRILSLTLATFLLRMMQFLIACAAAALVGFAFSYHFALGIVIGVPAIIFAVYLLIKMVAYSFYDLVIYDRAKRAWGGLKESYQVARGQLATIVLAWTVMILCWICVLLIVGGFIFGLIYLAYGGIDAFISSVPDSVGAILGLLYYAVQGLGYVLVAALEAGLYKAIFD